MQNQKTKYVLGFLFDAEKSYVVLIKKNKPEWQKGFLNGVGGKIEIGESSEEAMIREFEEETGVVFEGWTHFAEMEGIDWVVYCFYGLSDLANECLTNTEELVSKYPSNGLAAYKVVKNLHWLVPAALNSDGEYLKITYP